MSGLSERVKKDLKFLKMPKSCCVKGCTNNNKKKKTKTKQNIAAMLYHQVTIEESSGLQQSAEQLLIILSMFARISCGHQNQFIIMFSQNTSFQVSDFFEKLILKHY